MNEETEEAETIPAWILTFRGVWDLLYPEPGEWEKENKGQWEVVTAEQLSKRMEHARKIFESTEYQLYTNIVKRNRMVTFLEAKPFYKWKLVSVQIPKI